jgi:hypothetical protein
MLSAFHTETSEERIEKQDAIAFLRDWLRTAEQYSNDILAGARKHGISDRILKRVKKELNVQVRKVGFKSTKWFGR